MVNVLNWRDTIRVDHDRVHTRVLIRPETKTVYIASKCDSQIVVKKVPYQVIKKISARGYSGFRLWGQTVVGFLIGFILAWLLIKSLLRW